MLKTLVTIVDTKAVLQRRYIWWPWNHVRAQNSTKRFSTKTEKLTLSHVKGSTGVPLIHKPFGQVLEESVSRYPDRILVKSIKQKTQLTYAEALLEGDKIAAGLLSLGLKKGDRVALWAPNSWEWVVTSFAVLRSGLILVPMNPLLTGEDAIHCLTLTRPSAVIAPAEHNNIKYLDLLLQLAPELRDSHPGGATCARMPDLRAAICLYGKTPDFAVGLGDLSASTSESDTKRVQNLQKELDADDTGVLLFSSGTTGQSKAAVISHKNLVNNGRFVSEALPISDRSKPVVYCSQVPLFHVFGLAGVVCLGIQIGAKIILPSLSYSAEANLKAFKEEKCNVVSGTPTMYLDMVRRAEQDGRPEHQADVCIIGAGPLLPQLGKDILEVLRIKRFQVLYGLSESTGMVFQSTPDDTLDQMIHTVGKIKPNIEAKVVDPDGKTVPVNNPGELWIRGYVTMKEYFGEPEKTKECITEDGWLRTGDQFVITEDGYGKIIGRFKDIIIRGGENISPMEIEDVLTTHPSVVDTQVIGVKDERLSEEVCACFIVRKPITGEDIKEFLKNKVAKFKIPRYYVVMDSYPRTTSGKIQKHKLRDICNKLLNEGKLAEIVKT